MNQAIYGAFIVGCILCTNVVYPMRMRIPCAVLVVRRAHPTRNKKTGVRTRWNRLRRPTYRLAPENTLKAVYKAPDGAVRGLGLLPVAGLGGCHAR